METNNTAEGRHVFQKLILPEGGTLPQELFYRGPARRDGNGLILQDGETVAFDTYFNSLSAAQWKELTVIRDLRYELELSGCGRVQLWTCGAEGSPELLEEKAFGPAEGAVLLNRHAPEELGKICFLQIRAEGGPVQLRGGCITTESAPTQAPNLACCFCTYKREKEIRRNVLNLVTAAKDPGSALYGRADIYIADNGHTLTAEDFGNAEQVFLFENRNYGGSSGFTRCMIEAGIRKPGTYTHILLMDDDAVILPCVVERTCCLLSFLREEYRHHMIGGALLSLQKPAIQAECGAEFIHRGVVQNGVLRNLTDFDAVRNNDRAEPYVHEINFNAWIFSCFPAAFVTEDNLPLPLFLHGDDIEYGLRFRNRIIHMNGICVWHPDPALSRRPNLVYYDHRNYSIIEAVYDARMTPGKYRYTELKKILHLLVNYQYETALYAIWGSRDFLQGIDRFKELEPEELNRKILRWKQFPACHIENVTDEVFTEASDVSREPSRFMLLLNLILPARIERRVYDTNASWAGINFFRAKEICIVDRKTGDGILLRRDSDKQKEVMREFRALSGEIRKHYQPVAAQWRARIGEINSYSFWKTYLGI